MVQILIIRTAIIIAALIISSSFIKRTVIMVTILIKKIVTMVAILIIGSSARNKDCDHENCNQTVLTKSQSQLRRALKSNSKFSTTRSCEAFSVVVVAAIET